MVNPLIYPAMGVLGYGGHLIYKYGPSSTKPFGIFGISGVGKSTFHLSLRKKLKPVFQPKREETTTKGTKYRTKLKFDYIKSPYFKGRDYPWKIEDISEQMKEFNPKWIVWMLDVHTIKDPRNWQVIKEIIAQMNSSWYDKKNKSRYITYWSPIHGWIQRKLFWSGKGCKLLTIMLNKIDDYKGDRAEFCQGVADYYTADVPDNPLMELKSRGIFTEFIATSLKYGWYYPYQNLSGSGAPMKKYLEEVVEFI